MKILIFFLVFFLVSQPQTSVAADQSQNGIIKGTVVELESGKKLSGANIIVTKTLFGAPSNSNGEYQIMGLEAGTYTLECRLIGYKSISITDVQVKDDKATEITFILSPIILANDEITLNFQIPKRFPAKNINGVDPDFTIIVDPAVDPDMIIAVDPCVDPGIFMNSIRSSIVAKSIKDTIGIRILDSIKEKPKSKK